MALKAIEKYFSRYTAPEVYPWVSEMLRDIQAEVDSGYMKLPVDADGVPIHCGERMRLDNGHEGDVWLIGVFDIMMSDHTCFDWAKSRHVKPRTLTDVLCDLFERRMTVTDAEYELRELLGGDVR